jgi:hypothetical protein
MGMDLKAGHQLLRALQREDAAILQRVGAAPAVHRLVDADLVTARD